MKANFDESVRLENDPPKRAVDFALFLPSLAGGGAEGVFVTLAGLFAQRGLAVDLVVARGEGPLVNRVPESVRLVILGVSRPSRGIPALVRYLRRNRPRALLSALTHANIAATIAHRLVGGKRRCVLSERADLSVALREEKTSIDRRLTQFLGRRVYPWADAVVAVSEGVAESVKQVFGVGDNRLHVIYNPVDVEHIRQAAQAEAMFPWADTLPVFIAVGRLSSPKNFPLLLRAFSRVRQLHPCHLAIIGEGAQRQTLEALIDRLGIVEDVWLAGYREHPFALMAQATALVSSSNYEGLSNVLIEALALAVPVVATDCPSGSAEILAQGRYGLLVPVGNESALADAMLQVLAGNAPRFDHAEAVQRFHPDQIAETYLNILGVKP